MLLSRVTVVVSRFLCGIVIIEMDRAGPDDAVEDGSDEAEGFTAGGGDGTADGDSPEKKE
jgi:hypothetical protein